MRNKKIHSIERLVPAMVNSNDVTGQATLELHLQRYEFAAKHAVPGRILDIACGSGYGTRLLAEKGRDVIEAVGVDISRSTIKYAEQNYSSRRIRFIQHDAMTFTDKKSFDTIVSVETIEHVPEPDMLIKHLHGLLRSKGILIASVPTTPSVDVNPYHLYDFSEQSFRRMVAQYGFKEIACFRQTQPYPVIKTLQRRESRMKDMRQNLLFYYFVHPRAGTKRLWSTFRYGFTNRYITIAWQKQ